LNPLAAPEAAPGLKAIAQNRIKWLDGQIADSRKFLCGSGFTLADILLYCFMTFFVKVSQPIDPSNRNIAGWLERVGARPSMKA
jgi:glutathione S-transferase